MAKHILKHHKQGTRRAKQGQKRYNRRHPAGRKTSLTASSYTHNSSTKITPGKARKKAPAHQNKTSRKNSKNSRKNAGKQQ
jgi:hypothetical protein